MSYTSSGRPLHLLVNNAGVIATPLGQTKQGFETQLGTNHFGHFMLTRELVRRRRTSRCSRCTPGVIPTPLSRTMGIGGALFRFFGSPFMKTVAQGAATTIYASTAPELSGKSGAYLSDCNIATPSRDAEDAELTAKVWTLTERAIA